MGCKYLIVTLLLRILSTGALFPLTGVVFVQCYYSSPKCNSIHLPVGSSI
jgi:hypothetical protein